VKENVMSDLGKDLDLPDDDPVSTKVDDGSPDFELGHNREAMITGPTPSPTRTYDHEIGNGRRIDGDRLAPVEVDPFEQVRDHHLVQPQPDVPAHVDARSPEETAKRVRDFHGITE
jgi:hypothetical protein